MQRQRRALGSSPRVRGTHGHIPLQNAMDWFIPAGAGNTSANIPPSGLNPVHPRGCGEHCLSWRKPPSDHGSSPRVRGTPGQRRSIRPADRFIPAGAGNTGECGGICGDFSVHPRGCGEHAPSSVMISGSTGSSPRVRGTRGYVLHL